MRIDIDLDTNTWLAGPSLKYGIAEVGFKRDTSAILSVRFWQAGVVVELAAGATGEFGIKTNGEFDGDLLVYADSWTKVGNGANTVYQFAPALNSEALATALGHGNGDTSDDLASILAMAEILWIVDSKKYRTQTVPARIGNDILKDEDGTPLALPTPEEWLADRALPLPILRTDAQGTPINSRMTIESGSYDGTVINRTSTTYNSRPLWSTGIFRVEWTGTAWRFLTNGVEFDSAVGDTADPWDATWGTITLIPSGLPATHIGQDCRLGDASPYRWFKAAEIDPTIWEETTPGLILNRDTQIMERLFILDGIIQTEIATL